MKDTIQDLAINSFKEFRFKHDLSLLRIDNIYIDAWKAGYFASETINPKNYSSNYLKEDLTPRQWPELMPGQRIETTWMVSDIETCKKYLRLLMEWKNASNP